MLGLLEICGEGVRVKAQMRKIIDYDILCVAIPKISRRYLKKAAKKLCGMRAIVWNNCDTDYLRGFGINPVPPSKVYKYFTDKIFIKTIEQEELTKSTKVALFAGRVGDAEKRQIDRIIKYSRYISVKAANAEEISDWLMENYGISQIKCIKEPDVAIFMYDEDFSLSFIKNKCKYTLEKVDFCVPKRLEIGNEHIKSAYVALINIGALNPEDVDIGNISFAREKLT